MTLSIQQGRLLEARYCESPNQDARPDGVDIDLLVVHGISLPPGEFGGPWIEALFTNRLDPAAHPYFREVQGLEVSTHVLIRRDGELVQYVNFQQRAWHAGRSCFKGRERCNDFSIGVELEGTDATAYEPVQYTRLTELAFALMREYPKMTAERVVGHSDIAAGRKTDPGAAFDWDHFRQLLGRIQETNA